MCECVCACVFSLKLATNAKLRTKKKVETLVCRVVSPVETNNLHPRPTSLHPERDSRATVTRARRMTCREKKLKALLLPLSLRAFPRSLSPFSFLPLSLPPPSLVFLSLSVSVFESCVSVSSSLFTVSRSSRLVSSPSLLLHASLLSVSASINALELSLTATSRHNESSLYTYLQSAWVRDHTVKISLWV